MRQLYTSIGCYDLGHCCTINFETQPMHSGSTWADFGPRDANLGWLLWAVASILLDFDTWWDIGMVLACTGFWAFGVACSNYFRMLPVSFAFNID
ncbi:hypothetical protein G9A89_001750 [Geosiphon pyriformis]|nr:hypothetical protein G9A89_001750 [Geosiphon pyriformis]